ncbi:hypothetical protein SAMN05421858_3304 [Haladaptatus litoreus]|uniref:Uncharacterized protein n=1 Tax=Haladaptatus litoreus TaxID=553468 RepID=A0A1N7CWD7_9EURY|nr:hypothetical protein SAMN05421858_3304 [Haladaptatus litoreus]
MNVSTMDILLPHTQDFEKPSIIIIGHVTVYQGTSLVTSTRWITDARLLPLRKFEEKVPCFSAGMNPTLPFTNHRR